MVIIDDNKRVGFFKSLWGKRKENQKPSNEKEELSLEENQAESVVNGETEKIPDAEVVQESPLYLVYKMWQESLNKEIILSTIEFKLWKFNPIKESILVTIESQMENFVQQLEKESYQILNQIQQNKELAEKRKQEMSEEEAQEYVQEPEEPVDACVKIRLSKDRMMAFLFVFPPRYGGKEIKKENILEELKENKIVYGLKEDLINSITENKQYFQLFIVAEGVAAINGKDGSVIECAPKTSEIDIQEDEKGNVDYKNLNIIHTVEKGFVICEIINPTKGENGINILGETLVAKDGKAPKIPAGKNTVLSEDGTKLLSEIDGYISYEREKYRVENRLEIKSDVDNSVGNIDFLGDVVIYGEVKNGFKIKATGNVHVKEMVEGAEIYAGGSIVIDKGMNGNKHGILNAGEDIKCKFLENCTVTAGGSIYTESIVWCDIFCDQSVYAKNNKGVIIGGSITATKSVEAKMIGSKSNQKTSIILGITPNLLNERTESEQLLKTTEATLSMLEKNVNFLSSAPSLSEDKKKVLQQLKQQKKLYETQQKTLKERLEQIMYAMTDFSECRVKCDTIFPVTKITIGQASFTVTTISYKCNFYFSEDDVVLGSL